MSLHLNRFSAERIVPFNSYDLPNETVDNSDPVYPEIPEFPPLPIFVLKTTICLAVLLITIIGNSLVVLSFIKFKKLQTYTNYYIVTLAVADLASGITPIVLNVPWIIGYWPFGNTVCMVSVYLNTVFVHTTFLLTFIICVDRYRALIRPLKHLQEKNRKHAAKMLLPGILIPPILWAVVILILPPLGVFRPIRPLWCYVPYASNKAALLGSSIIISWIPIIGTSCLYCFIYFRVIRKRLNNNFTTKATTKNPAPQPDGSSQQPNGSCQQPDGSSQQPDGSSQQLNRSSQQPDGSSQQLNRSSQQPKGSSQQPNGSCQQPKGYPRQPNGSCQQPKGSSQQIKGSPQQPNGSSQQPNDSSPVDQNKSSNGGARRVDEPSQAQDNEEHGHPNNIEIVTRSIDGASQQNQETLKSTYHNKRFTSSRRATRTLAYIIVVMVISGTPYSIYSLFITIWPDLPYIHTINWLVAYIVHLSSATNPFCYASCNPLFKQAFIRLLCCGLRWRQNDKGFSSGLN